MKQWKVTKGELIFVIVLQDCFHLQLRIKINTEIQFTKELNKQGQWNAFTCYLNVLMFCYLLFKKIYWASKTSLTIKFNQETQWFSLDVINV